jgi:uncharacterized protein
VNITTSFEVAAPLAEVWAHMLDVPQVARCVPGAELTEVVDERTYAGKVEVKLGPIAVGYGGRLRIEAVDEAAHQVRLRAEGNESRGRGGASATVTATLKEVDGRTEVNMVSEVAVSGIVAQFGRSAIMQEVAQRMAKRFASCLEQQLKAPRTV